MNAHVDMEVESKEELAEDIIVTKVCIYCTHSVYLYHSLLFFYTSGSQLRACGGAHAPTSYEFHSYSK